MTLKEIFLSINFLSAISIGSATASIEIKLAESGESQHQVKVLIGVMPETDTDLMQLAQATAKVISSSKQFLVDVTGFDQLKNQQEIGDIFNKKYSLVIFLNHTLDKQAIEWRLYDSSDASMVKGKKIYKRGSLERGWAYQLADDLWQAMTNQPSSFSSKLAYIKRKKDMFGRPISAVCICDFDGSHETELARTGGMLVGVHWNNSVQYPKLCISEFTKFNVRLVAFDLSGRKQTVLETPGTCVGISFSPDNNQAVYCKSGEIWHYRFDAEKKRGVHRLVIKNDGKNTSPILLHSSDIIFCSDAEMLFKQATGASNKRRVPKIYYYHADTKKTDLLTRDGYCVSPAYNSANNKIVFAKRINGTMQLCTYNLKNQKQEQLTHDAANKTDCTWSACGTQIYYCYEAPKTHRIAVMHAGLKTTKFLTPAAEYCLSPAASPVFATYPVIKGKI